jgi:hypothetical protein
MFNRKHSARIAAVAAGLSIVGLLNAAPAMAKDGDVEVTGPCSAGSTFDLKLGVRDGGIETEFEVDSNVVGQTWKVRIADNGARVFAHSAVTTAPSGSFDVRTNLPNLTGTDNVVAKAVNPATGEKCVAKASI